MLDFKALTQRSADLVQTLEAIEAAADGEFTDEQRTEHDAATAALEVVAGDLKRLERRRDAELAALKARRDEDDEEPPRMGVDHATERPWDSHPEAHDGFGQFLMAVAAERMPGGTSDPRLFKAAISGASTSVPSDGGHLVGLEHNTMLMARGMETSVLAQRCTNIPVGDGFDGVELPSIDETSRADGSRWGGVRLYRAGEADSVTATKPTIKSREIRLEDLNGLAYATRRSLRDASSLQAIFTTAFASEFAFKIDDEIVRGSGVGECQGLIPSGAAAGATISQAKETGQTADTVVASNFSKMHARLHPRHRGNAAWFVNAELGPNLDILAVDRGTSGDVPAWIRYGEDGVMRIKGLPVIPLEQCSAPGDVGDVLLADLSEYLLVTKGGVEAESSTHVRFIFNEMTFKWTQRINGQKAWRSALTPFKGANTLSPYVTLAARA